RQGGYKVLNESRFPPERARQRTAVEILPETAQFPLRSPRMHSCALAPEAKFRPEHATGRGPRRGSGSSMLPRTVATASPLSKGSAIPGSGRGHRHTSASTAVAGVLDL